MTTSAPCGVVLLAAGQSERMGQSKLLLPWGTSSMLGHQLQLWQQLRPHQLTVVCSTTDTALHAELNRLGLPIDNRIFNPQPELGMFSSIRRAAQWPGWDHALTHWVVTLGDQPHLKSETLRTLLRFSADHPDNVCQPCRLGQLHHPVILPRHMFRKLAGTRADTLKEFLKTIPDHVIGCEVEDAGLGLDIDTPEDYARARLKFLGPDESGHEARAG